MTTTNPMELRETLTPQRQGLYDWIVKFSIDNGYFPTLREISEETGMSLTNVWHHVNVLKQTGLLVSGDRQRAFRVVGVSMEFNPVYQIRLEE